MTKKNPKKKQSKKKLEKNYNIKYSLIESPIHNKQIDIDIVQAGQITKFRNI